MRERNLIGWISILAMLVARLAAAGDSELIELERERSRAIQAGDIAFLERLYAGDFAGVTTTGQVVDRAALMTVFRNFDKRLEATHHEMGARVFGDVAVVSGLLKLQRETEPAGAFRFTHIYVRREGRWQLTAGQSTNVSQP